MLARFFKILSSLSVCIDGLKGHWPVSRRGPEPRRFSGDPVSLARDSILVVLDNRQKLQNRPQHTIRRLRSDSDIGSHCVSFCNMQQCPCYFISQHFDKKEIQFGHPTYELLNSILVMDNLKSKRCNLLQNLMHVTQNRPRVWDSMYPKLNVY